MAQVQDLNPREKHSAESSKGETAQLGGVADESDRGAGARYTASRRRASELVCVHYGGRHFIASYEMAGIFLRRAQRLIDANEAELVPLLHEGGLEMLHVTPAMPFSVHDVDAEPADSSHPSPPSAGTHPSEVA